jgi:hypothetical protein
MAIDTSGTWWKGSDFHDLSEYIGLLNAEGYTIGQVIQSLCTCQNRTFTLRVDAREGCAQRTCTSCHNQALIGDSADIWAEATPSNVRCRCRHTIFEVGIGFSFRDKIEVRWITVGHRCVSCGILGSAVNWGVDYVPSSHLLNNV